MENYGINLQTYMENAFLTFANKEEEFENINSDELGNAFAYCPTIIAKFKESTHYNNLLHCTTGMGEEAIEIYEELERLDFGYLKNNLLVGELGDLMWYVICLIKLCESHKELHYINALQFNIKIENWEGTYFPDIPYGKNGNKKEQLIYLMKKIKIVQNIIKKYVYYGKQLNNMEDKLWESLLNIILFVKYTSEQTCGITFQEVLHKNILKLKERYGNKFAKDKALNRNNNKELQALS